MKNLYEQLDSIREKNRNEVLEVALSNRRGTLSLINYVLSGVTDYLESNKYERYNFRRDFESVEIHCSFEITSKDLKRGFRVSKKYYKEMGQLLCSFLRNYGLGDVYWFDENSLKFSINCSVKTFQEGLAAYCNLVGERLSQKENEILSVASHKVECSQTHVEDAVAKDLYYDFFEKKFLDKRLRGIINQMIASTNHSSFMLNGESRKIDYRIEYVSSAKSYVPTGSMVIPKAYFEPMCDLIDSFMRYYKLGDVFYRGTGSDEFSVHLKCSLEQLMNVYYMEKQRIGYIVGNKATEKPIERSRQQKK